MGCQRPAWTTCFGFICVLVVPGAILTHMSVTKLIPAIGDLPDNVVSGFDKTFKFQYLVSDSNIIKQNCKSVITKCGVQASTYCPDISNKNPASLSTRGSKSTITEKTAIQNAFTNSLDTVNKIASDPYLGTAEFKSTADNLKKVKNELNKVQSPMNCAQAVPTFCAIWTSSDQLVKGKQQVDDGINKFKDGDIIKQWEKNKGYLQFLHALPYFMVLGLAFFAFFIWKNGVCCCCKDGTVCGSLANIPFLIFWLVSFIIYFIVFAVGTGVKYFKNKIDVPVLNGKPTLEVAVNHIQVNFKEFWDAVFKQLVEGLDILWYSSLFFSVVAILIILYVSCVCCCRPWQKIEEKKSAPSDAGNVDEEKHVTV